MARTDYGAILSTVIKDTSDAIREVKGSSGLIAPADWGTEIRSISGGPELKDVNYFDCFGNVLFAYTAAEFAQLSAHPAGSNIESKGVPLTFDSWNYTFSNAQTYVTKYGKLNIGGIYHPTDNKTHIFLDIKSAAYSNIDIRFTATTTATVDWGDGTTETVSGAFTSKHNYNDSGVFEITIDGAITLSSELLPDKTQAKYLTDALLCNITSLGGAFAYCSSLASVSIPDGVTSINTFVTPAFACCSSLSSISIPNSVTNIVNGNMFYCCSSLTLVSIPNSITSMGGYDFANCPLLTSIIIPESVTSIGSYDFQYCHSLTSLKIPAGVTTIGNQAFYYTSNLVYIDFSEATAIPTLGGSSVFGNAASLSAIIVPDSLYEDWKVASRWSGYANIIVKASEYIKPF